MAAFLIWCMVAGFFIVLGIVDLFLKKPAGFWANTERPEVTDVRGFNRAMCILWCSFGGIMILLGIPLLAGQNSGLIVVTILGLFAEVIATMVVYMQIIEKKFTR